MPYNPLKDPEADHIVAFPKMYAVILHNDDYTPMEFVVALLMKIFGKSAEDASALMLEVHTGGESTAGVYAYDIAASKKLKAERLAEEHNHPLRLSIRLCSMGD